MKLFKKTREWVNIESHNYHKLMVKNNNQRVNRSMSLVLKLTPEITATLAKVFNTEVVKQVDSFLTSTNAINILDFIQSLFDGCGQVGKSHQQWYTYKLIHEETLLVKLLHSFGNVLESSPECQLLLIEYLLKDIETFKGEAYTDAIIHYKLRVLNQMVLTG